MAEPVTRAVNRPKHLLDPPSTMAGHHGTGFNPHLPGFKHKFLATTLGATMWFFIFYRARCVCSATIQTALLTVLQEGWCQALGFEAPMGWT
ncbi:hypothetical protein C2E23DRAFT_612073 [Lenzites betulinus]|nr:hypothetical protein C2E23DRAFT_612073 [Lenzites betulinus]